MAEQHLITAEFFGAPVNIIDHDGKRWLTADEIGRCLGYQEASARIAVSNLYNRNINEFTAADTFVIKLMANPQGGNPNTRVFSATGCIKLGFFANTTQATRFRNWAAEALESRVEPPLPAVTHSPRLEASMKTLADQMGVLAKGMALLTTQHNVTGRYIHALERNQRGTVKITPEIREQAKAMAAEGMPLADVGRLLRISRTSVSLIVHDKYPETKVVASAPPPTAGDQINAWIEREEAKVMDALGKLEGGAA